MSEPTASPTLPAPPAARPRRRWRGWAAAGVLAAGGAGAAGYWAVRPAPAPPPQSEAAARWEAAQAALAADDLPAAREQLGKFLDAVPLNAEAHFLLARAARRADDYDGWDAHLRRAAVLGWPAEQIELETHLRMAQSGDLLPVDRFLAGYANTRPADEEIVLEALARGYLEAQRLGSLRGMTKVWAERRPDSWLALLYRGRARQFASDEEGAVADYRRSLELKPDSPRGRLWLAQLHMARNEPADALPHFRAYLAARPDDPDGLFGAAQCEAALGRAADARATLARLFAARPRHVSGLLAQARLDLAEGDAAAALAALRTAEAVTPNEPEVAFQLAQACQQAGRTAEAKGYQERHARLVRTADELDETTRRIGDRPDDLELRHRAGVLALALGREAAAAQWFKSVLWTDRGYRPTHAALADYYAAKGDAARAADHRRQAGGP